ncbi:MAG TPA: sigma-70 family RNA polymerase sigma factor [Steroidobacteraceae bacterium]|nr:sigma-70 family RNA polymerase sigma factor [Steroidobacteraceae bacterium]
MHPSARKQRLADWARNWNAGLTRFLRRRVPQQIDPEDLAQEVYLRLLRVEHLDMIEEPQAYLYRVASNVAAEWRMRACYSKPHSDELDVLTSLSNPETQVEETVLMRRLDAALAEMTPMIRAVVYLKVRDSLSHDEIAQHLSITPRMVRRMLTKGYEHLRTRLVLDRS